MQLDIMATNLSPRTDEYDLPSLLKQVKEMCAAQRSLLCQVFILTSLIVIMPATYAVLFGELRLTVNNESTTT